MKHLKKLSLFLIFIYFLPIVQSLEYNQYSEPAFSIDGKTLIKSINFCFEHDGEILCRKVGDFQDDIFGISCDYTMFVRKEDVIHYYFKSELNESGKICPLVLNLDTWPQKIITDDFESWLVEEPKVFEKFPFILSGNNRSLYFPENKDYEYNLSKLNGEYILNICSKQTKNIHESSFEIVAISDELNQTNFHNNPSISLYENPPSWAGFGPEVSLKIIITEFFTGNIFEWHPELPYANLALKLYPINLSYDDNEPLLIEYASISGRDKAWLPYDVKNKFWLFPESGTRQIKFDYNSWFFPLSKYTSKIMITEGNITLVGNYTFKIPNSEFLDGFVSFNNNEIKIEMFHNLSEFLLLLIVIITFYLPLLYSFKKIKSKTKINKFQSFYQLIPFVSILILIGIIPFLSIFNFVILLSYGCFWSYFIYKKYLKKQK